MCNGNLTTPRTPHSHMQFHGSAKCKVESGSTGYDDKRRSLTSCLPECTSRCLTDGMPCVIAMCSLML